MAIKGSKYVNGSASAQISSDMGKVYGIIVNSHTSGTFRLNDGIGGTTSAGVKATGVLTGTDVISNGETVTIGTNTYTFLTALTNLVPNEVKLGTLAVSLDNLKLAINKGSGEGTLYSTGTVANPNVTATTNTDTAQTVESIKVGTDANSISTTETGDDISWGAVVLENGAEANLLITNTFTLSAGSQVVLFPEAINFYAGLYLTLGGTLDYTVLYSPEK